MSPWKPSPVWPTSSSRTTPVRSSSLVGKRPFEMSSYRSWAPKVVSACTRPTWCWRVCDAVAPRIQRSSFCSNWSPSTGSERKYVKFEKSRKSYLMAWAEKRVRERASPKWDSAERL